jgi:hypothetical protein
VPGLLHLLAAQQRLRDQRLDVGGSGSRKTASGSSATVSSSGRLRSWLKTRRAASR